MEEGFVDRLKEDPNRLLASFHMAESHLEQTSRSRCPTFLISRLLGCICIFAHNLDSILIETRRQFLSDG